jgi:hypothetical protein
MNNAVVGLKSNRKGQHPTHCGLNIMSYLQLESRIQGLHYRGSLTPAE